jgi:primary-amine oxidase
VGATGVDALRWTRSGGQADENGITHGAQMDGTRQAPFHDHFFNWRLDMDVDGQANRLVVGTLKAYTPTQANVTNRRKTMWGVEFAPVAGEAEGKRDLDNGLQVPEVWAVANAESVDPATLQAASYVLQCS